MSISEFKVARDWKSNHSGPVRWILSHVRRHALFVAGMLVGAAGNAGLAAAMPLLIGRAVSAVTSVPADIQRLTQAAIWIAASQLVRGLVLQLMRNWSSEMLGQRLERDIRDELYASLLGKSMSFHDSQPTGDLMARATNDVRQVNLMFNPGVNLVVGSANFLLMPLFAAPSIHPQLVAAPILYLFAYAFAVKNYLGNLRPATERVRHSFGDMNASLAESIDGIETVKGATQEHFESDRFTADVANWRDAYVHQGDIEARFIPLLLLGLVQGAGFLHSLLLFRSGSIGLDGVVAFNGLLLLFGFPTFAAQFAYSRVSSGIASARRILELITFETELDQNAAGHDAAMEGRVAFEDVTFCYTPPGEGCSIEDQSATLEAVSFLVEPGQTIAIVGQTGSGKSTVGKLISRIYDVDEGRVLVDGIDVRDWNLEALRRQISTIEQDLFLFSRPISENIAFGNPEADQADVVAAAEAAQAHAFITDFEEGYETVIGERGATLSGGQRQRLAIARAFLTAPAILILDDATSAIDSETEDLIQRAIERAAAGRTTFLITHRLSQIRWADLIIVMRGGTVAAVGRHEQLMDESPAYREIFARYEQERKMSG